MYNPPPLKRRIQMKVQRLFKRPHSFPIPKIRIIKAPSYAQGYIITFTFFCYYLSSLFDKYICYYFTMLQP